MATAAENSQSRRSPTPTRSDAKSQNQSRYMFVEYSAPAAPVPKGTKKRRGGPSEVRAHITKEFHRRLRVKRLDALKGEPGLNDHSPTTGNYFTLPERSRSFSSSTSPELEDERGGEDEYLEASTCHASSTSRTSLSTVASTPPSTDVALQLSMPRKLQTLLGEGRMDPFAVLPSQGNPLFIHRVFDHALVHTWPNTVPAHSQAIMNPVQAAWYRCAMEHPVAFHAFLYATMLHLDWAHQGREVIANSAMLRLSHKLKTINLLKDAINTVNADVNAAKSSSSSSSSKHSCDSTDPHDKNNGNSSSSKNKSTTITDALIMAIAILAVHGSRDDVVYPKVHPVSPLAEAQNVHVYGNMTNSEEHVRWVNYMILQKGGLDTIELYGMADTMALCDLYFSTKHVCPPTLPLRRKPESLVISGKHLLDAISIDLDSKLGTGFKYFRFLPDARELLSVLESFCEVTVALDHYARGGPTAPDLTDLVVARHASQHRLLSQLPPPQTNFLNGDHSMMHACRLATLVFSDMVIFPLPATQGLKHRLAPLLRHTLEACSIISNWELHAYVLLWATTLGAIAATFSFDRRWYVERMVENVEMLGIQSWAELESTCSRFLWWKPVCSEPAEKLWVEMFPPFDDVT